MKQVRGGKGAKTLMVNDVQMWRPPLLKEENKTIGPVLHNHMLKFEKSRPRLKKVIHI